MNGHSVVGSQRSEEVMEPIVGATAENWRAQKIAAP